MLLDLLPLDTFIMEEDARTAHCLRAAECWAGSSARGYRSIKETGGMGRDLPDVISFIAPHIQPESVFRSVHT